MYVISLYLPMPVRRRTCKGGGQLASASPGVLQARPLLSSRLLSDASSRGRRANGQAPVLRARSPMCPVKGCLGDSEMLVIGLFPPVVSKCDLSSAGVPSSWASTLALLTTPYCSAWWLAQPLGSVSSLEYLGRQRLDLSAHFNWDKVGLNFVLGGNTVVWSPLEKLTALARWVWQHWSLAEILSTSLEQSNFDNLEQRAELSS